MILCDLCEVNEAIHILDDDNICDPCYIGLINDSMKVKPIKKDK